MQNQNFLTISDVAMLENKSIKFVRKEVLSSSLKSIKTNNKYLIDENEYKRWKQSYKNCNTKREQPKKAATVQNDVVNWIDVHDEMNTIDGWNNSSDRNGLNFIDLFTGAGGLSCGLTMAGFTPVGSLEIMDAAVKTYKHNFLDVKGFDENIEKRDICEKSVKENFINSFKNKHINLIAGGFPCQGFSVAGNRIVTDKRNSLYKEMLEIVQAIKPDFVLMENVEGLRSMCGGEIEKKIISDYKEIGYDINVTVLNAADYGVPQTRKRVVFIGNRLGKINYHPEPIFNVNNYKTVRDSIEKFMNMDENIGINHEFTRHSDKIKKALAELKEGESLYKNYSDAWKRVYWEKPSPTVKENHGGVNVHPKLPRVMTPRELASLQSFPNDFIFMGTKKWQLVQIGNAVPPLLGKAIGFAIEKSIKGEKNDE